MSSSHRDRAILIVDDDDAQRKLLADFLTAQHYECHQAASAEEALAALPKMPLHAKIAMSAWLAVNTVST